MTCELSQPIKFCAQFMFDSRLLELSCWILVEFYFMYVSVTSGQPRRHLLQSGWSVFVSAKRLVAGDAFIFLRYVFVTMINF